MKNNNGSNTVCKKINIKRFVFVNIVEIYFADVIPDVFGIRKETKRAIKKGLLLHLRLDYCVL